MPALVEGIPRERTDFSQIRTSIKIPNLIEVQKRSYERFLQMECLPSERKDIGLQSVFKSVFPITDFRDTCSLEFVEYSIGNWECKCGALKGLEHLRANCVKCGARITALGQESENIFCVACGALNRNIFTTCDICGDPVSLRLKYEVQECQERGMTFAVSLKVTIRLVVWDKDEKTGAKNIRDIKEQEVYFGDIPLMTENGTFVINGTERVIVSQLHRSPGVFFHASEGKTMFSAQVIPYRGSWVEFEYDNKNLLYVRVDRKRKFLATVFLRALGVNTDEDILRRFYSAEKISIQGKKFHQTLSPGTVGFKSSADVSDPATGESILKKGKKITHSECNQLKKAGIDKIPINEETLLGKAYAMRDVVDLETGEVYLEANEELTEGILEKICAGKVPEIELFYPERQDIGSAISMTLRKDPIKSTDDALLEIYRRLRPGDPPTSESAHALFHGMFFNPQKYDFSRVGRLKLNTKLELTTPLDEKILMPEDYYAVINYLLKLKKNIGNVDDIDHLGNRRVRSVGELLENQFRIGLVRMERAIKEKMSVYQEMTTAIPHDLINAKPVMAAIREFFGSSQLSQFMDQTNPLSEITHKRRLSALGPGGLSRERAGFEVRDVHPTHYGRICPIETPEGPNIGLISSLSCYARINEFGFIESPYRKVENGRVLDYCQVSNVGDGRFKLGEVVLRDDLQKENKMLREKKLTPVSWTPYSFYLTAWEEDKYVIAQANAQLDEKGNFVQERVSARFAGDFKFFHRNEIDYIDVSPKQLVSVAASLIPFLENDDANRALMGSNMQRQAVPLLRPQTPLVGTGMEGIAARDSGAVVVCRHGGVVEDVDSERVIVRIESSEKTEEEEEFGADIYQLVKFRRSNQNTCINQRPIVRKGQRVEKGDVVADGPCTDGGELALGRNVLVAFMPWRGYNFEDAILVSERLVKNDYFTSLHIEEFEIEARDTKLGPEEITRDIPNVGEDFLKNLDESGIIRTGAYVKPGDILVGKVTPKGETQLTPEEKLLRAIFGEKARDVRDASLYTPPGIEGIVVDAKIFSRKGVDKDARAHAVEMDEVSRLQKNLEDETSILNDERKKKLSDLLLGRTLAQNLMEKKSRTIMARAGQKITKKLLDEMGVFELKHVVVKPTRDNVQEKIDEVNAKLDKKIEVLHRLLKERVARLRKGDELSPGVIKMVKAYVAMKRKLSVGDKMAGRHGNKGVIARIVAEEDMPFLPDGRPVDIVLNPLGVPSRMNVGQILETHLGWAAATLDKFFATPVFDGATEKDIKKLLEQASLPLTGKTVLYDGLTGEPFEQEVTVGYIYLMKLSHLVDDKIHARSIGPYSLITQQPLGGKAQFGGQRLGEMEVWALEAYGAANTLQELLTVKSDDVYGRTKIYEALVKGEPPADPGLPESFNVLIRELQSLCLNVELLKSEDGD
jgi:DNA-directed RNA polymerase subunit beta